MLSTYGGKGWKGEWGEKDEWLIELKVAIGTATEWILLPGIGTRLPSNKYIGERALGTSIS